VEAQYLDHYSYLDSPIHRVPAHLKLAAALGVVALALLFSLRPPWGYVHLLIAAAWVACAIVSTVPILQMLRRVLGFWLVIVVLSAGRLFDENGIYVAFSSLVRGTECLLIMALIANTTRFDHIVRVMKALNMPTLLVTTISLMYRYLFVLSDETRRMRRARQARTLQKDKVLTWRLNANIITHLFIRCAERAQRIHSAMLARGA
jgi:cobalt/nickel transport system permease protein